MRRPFLPALPALTEGSMCLAREAAGWRECPGSSMPGEVLCGLTLGCKSLVHKAMGLKVFFPARGNKGKRKNRDARTTTGKQLATSTKAEQSTPGDQQFHLAHSRHIKRPTQECSACGLGVVSKTGGT